MGLPERAIEVEIERFKRLTQEFRDRVAGGTTVGDSETERERIYEILVSINQFIEGKLRES